jgi:hypothetical protein
MGDQVSVAVCGTLSKFSRLEIKQISKSVTNQEILHVHGLNSSGIIELEIKIIKFDKIN